jgi:hypothetical protein
VLLGFVPGGLEVELAFSVQEPDGARRQAIQSQVAQALILTLNAHGASFAPAPPEAAAQRSRAA